MVSFSGTFSIDIFSASLESGAVTFPGRQPPLNLGSRVGKEGDRKELPQGEFTKTTDPALTF